MIAPTLFSAIALLAAPAAAASAYEMEIHVRDKARETVFLAPQSATAGSPLPVFRICYHTQATLPPPETLSVHVGDQHQLLGRGRCSFFSGDRIDLSVWKGDGTIRATVTLLR